MKLNNTGIYFIFFAIFILSISCNNSNKSGARANKKENENLVNDSFSKPSNYNLYIDNSASIDGYVTANPSTFKNSVYGIMTKLITRNIARNISLNFVNEGTCNYKIKAQSDDIKKFIENLNSIRKDNQAKCDFKNSDLPTMLKNVISTNPNDVNILISDCILSYNGKTKDFLSEAQTSINLFLKNEFDKHEISTIVLKYRSQFSGAYYMESKGGTIANISDKNFHRPYYVIIFGSQEKINFLLEKIKFNESEGFENSFYSLVPSAKKPLAKIITSNKIGDFEIAKPLNSLTINGAKTGDKDNDQNVFQFSLAANLDFLKTDESYITNPDNYELPENYKIISIVKNKDEANEGLKNYSHVFMIRTTELKERQEVCIKLKTKIPEWVSTSSNNDDSNPTDTMKQNQTFGFKYFIQGINEAYKDKYEGKEQFTLNVKICKDNYQSHGTGSSFPWWIIFVIMALVGIVIWIKNKK